MTASLAKLHANYSHDWWTPPAWVDWVTATLGEGWTDPCPQDWKPGDPSGLDVDWSASTYVNHPGSRGSAALWWDKYQAEQKRHGGQMRFAWCQFNVESLRQLRPSPFHLPGWLIWPRERTPFIWGGPDIEATDSRAARIHGQPMTQPGNCAVWWTNCKPTRPPGECVGIRTGIRGA